MRNNNRVVVRKITARALHKDSRRNFFIIAAIALTTFMITAVFSVGISYYETMLIIPLRSEGMRTHAAVLDITPEDMETMSSLDYIEHISTAYRTGMGYPKGFEQGIPMIALNEESWDYFQTPAFTDIEGSLAAAENEIMLSRAHLSKMGIDEPVVGMEIPMEVATGDFYADGLSEKYSETFILSAIYTEYVHSATGNAFTTIFVSEAFAEQCGLHNLENANVNIIFTNQSRAVEYTNRLAQDLNIAEDEVVVHPSLERQTDIGSSSMYVAIGIIVAFFMFVGFLLVYNVMYISVSKDVRFYGLLKTMGTTPQQLSRIVNGQVLRMYMVGLPIGLIAAALMSFVLVPILISGLKVDAVVSFSPLIYVGGTVFSLLTAYLGAFVSARKAAKVSPIEAIRYAGEQSTNLKPRSQAFGRPSRMAWRNIFRERKRAVIVLLSLCLGITVFESSITIANSMDVVGSIEYWYNYDVIISDTNTAVNDFGLAGMDRGFINEIANLPGVSEVREQTEGFAAFEYPQAMTDSLSDTQFLTFLAIEGIDRGFMEELNGRMEDPIDIEAFERGEIVLVDEMRSETSLGDMFYEYFPVGRELYFEIGEESRIPVNTQIGGYTDIMNLTGFTVSVHGAGLHLIMSNTFLDSIAGKAGTNHLGVNIEEGMTEQVNTAISALAEESDMVMTSAYEAQREREEAQQTMFILGSTISGILALIGIFNFINLISVGLITRKREFAALESVGMSKKQMRLMLRWEGAIYWILTVTVSITAGTGIAYGLFRLVHNQDPVLLPQFNYPVLPVFVIYALVVLICTVTPEVCYRGISKSTLVERLREAE